MMDFEPHDRRIGLWIVAVVLMMTTICVLIMWAVHPKVDKNPAKYQFLKDKPTTGSGVRG